MAPRKRLAIYPVHRGMASLYVRGNMLLARLPNQLGLGRHQFLALGLPNTPQGQVRAIGVLGTINSDIVNNNFDHTGVRYQVGRAAGPTPTVAQLWDQYCDAKQGKVRESTQDYLRETIGSKLRLMPPQGAGQNLLRAQQVSEWVTTASGMPPDYALRVLKKVSALYEWAATHRLIDAQGPINPYKHFVALAADELATKEPDEPRPLSAAEVGHLLANITPRYLVPLVRFCLLTGCRPAEAVGFEWQDVRPDHLVVGRSLRVKGSKVFRSATDKTGRVRRVPLTEPLGALMAEARANQKIKGCALVFPQVPSGKPVVYDNYARSWRRIMPPDTTPYGCRDTFISRQIELGVPPAVVAKWVGNSVGVIDKHYLAVGLEIKPVEMLV